MHAFIHYQMSPYSAVQAVLRCTKNDLKLIAFALP